MHRHRVQDRAVGVTGARRVHPEPDPADIALVQDVLGNDLHRHGAQILVDHRDAGTVSPQLCLRPGRFVDSRRLIQIPTDLVDDSDDVKRLRHGRRRAKDVGGGNGRLEDVEGRASIPLLQVRPA